MKRTKETHGITKKPTSTKDKKQETITKDNDGFKSRPVHHTFFCRRSCTKKTPLDIGFAVRTLWASELLFTTSIQEPALP